MHDPGTGLSFLVIALLLFGGFVVLLAVIATAVGRATRSGGDGNGKRGCLGGCGLVLVLLFLALLGFLGLGAFVATASMVAAVEHNPVRSIEVDVGPEDLRYPRDLREQRRGEVPVRLRFEVVGQAGEEIARRIAQQVANEAGRDVSVTFHPPAPRVNGSEDSERVSIVEVVVLVDRRDVEEFEEIGRNVAGRGIEGLRIELQSSSVGF